MTVCKDSTTLAYINLFGVLGTLENLCALDDKAKDILRGQKPVSIGLFVKNGPSGVLHFADGGCKLTEGKSKCTVAIPFSSCEKFNGMIDGTVMPIPVSGFHKIGFLLKTFTALTDRLSELMRPTPEALLDPAFKLLSTTLMCYTIGSSIAQIANNDFIGKFTAHEMADGDVAFEVKDGPSLTIHIKNHRLSVSKTKCANPRGFLQFESMDTARNVFDNVENSMSCVCEGKIIMTGLISLLDNVNRLLDRVSVYLA